MTVAAIDAPLSLCSQDTLPIHDRKLFERYPALGAFARGLGHTPVINVPSPLGGASILAKCEWYNPTGSVKDRVAFAMVRDLLARSVAKPDTLVEYSGGNLAKALSRLCHDLEIKLHVVVSSGVAPSLLEIMRTDGTTVTLVEQSLGFLAVIEAARSIASKDETLNFLYQHRNLSNIRFHEETTGREVVNDLREIRADAWVASVGSGGTFVGVAQALAAGGHSPQLVCVTPRELEYGSEKPPNGLPKYGGSGGLGFGIRQPFVRAIESQVSRFMTVSCEQAYIAMADFYGQTGLRIGSSSAANWLAAWDVAEHLESGQTVVTIFPCAGTPEEWSKVKL